MDGNGRPGQSSRGALHWQGRIVSAEDLRQRLDGHAELVLAERTIITPLAADELRTRGIRVVRQTESGRPPGNCSGSQWLISQERPFSVVTAAISGLQRDGMSFAEVPLDVSQGPASWPAKLARRVGGHECTGAVVFCEDAAVAICLASKCKGVRGAAVYSVSQAARAASTLAANFVAVEMPGRTLFEVRQILRTICGSRSSQCPEPIAAELKELDGHAHR